MEEYDSIFYRRTGHVADGPSINIIVVAFRGGIGPSIVTGRRQAIAIEEQITASVIGVNTTKIYSSRVLPIKQPPGEEVGPIGLGFGAGVGLGGGGLAGISTEGILMEQSRLVVPSILNASISFLAILDALSHRFSISRSDESRFSSESLGDWTQLLEHGVQRGVDPPSLPPRCHHG